MARQRQPLHIQRGTRRPLRGGLTRREERLELPPHHHPDDLVLTRLCERLRHRDSAVPEDRDAVGDHEHFLDLVRDVDDRSAGVPQLPQDLEQSRNALTRERGARFVHDQQPRLPVEDSRNLDKLLLGKRKALDEISAVTRGTDVAEDFGGATVDRAVVDAAADRPRLATEKYIRADTQRRNEAQLLVDQPDAERQRGRRRNMRDRVPGETDLAGVG